ncbi:MAG: hypothetical protein QM802_12805 [Agriterribacter sp.]
MKHNRWLALLMFISITGTSCEAVGTIFKAGMWWAFFLVGLVVVFIIWIISKSRKNS